MKKTLLVLSLIFFAVVAFAQPVPSLREKSLKIFAGYQQEKPMKHLEKEVQWLLKLIAFS